MKNLKDKKGHWERIKASYGKEDFQIDDQGQREQYVRECLEQIAEASKEVDNLQFEYNMVTSYLKDMEEVESIVPAWFRLRWTRVVILLRLLWWQSC